MKLTDIQHLLSEGESETLEFKKSTGQLTRAAETLCAFLNANGGTVIIGVTPERKIVGQQVSDKTQQDIANILQKFEPPAPVEIKRIRLSQSDRELILLQAAPRAKLARLLLTGVLTSVLGQRRQLCRKSAINDFF